MKPRFNIFYALVAMITAVAASNYLVQFSINDWLTWGAFLYPITFFITELTNRSYGPIAARKIVYVGFGVAVVLSAVLAPAKIAAASGLAFLVSQLLDISVFNRLRKAAWWVAPFFASFTASAIDTAIFWSIAFYGENVPLLTWALGDFAVKVAVDVMMLTPFRLAMSRVPLFGERLGRAV